ncbi:MAG: alpha/beta fold hydrolase [Betaproteobacteria bacterium]
MNATTEQRLLHGSMGLIEVLLDKPPHIHKGFAFIAHPHPLFGGTMENKVVQTLARAFVQSGWGAVRFNFRGVGQSDGVHDNGVGEVEDMLRLIEQLSPEGPIAIAGFSFGAFVASQVHKHLESTERIQRTVLVGVATSRFDVANIATHLHVNTLVIHGEEDDTVPLSSVLDWARPQSLPVLVFPGCGHFFHGQLPLLKSRVVQHLTT